MAAPVTATPSASRDPSDSASFVVAIIFAIVASVSLLAFVSFA